MIVTAFRKKNPHRKGEMVDETISSAQFTHGLVVWVPGPNGREQRICTEPYGALLTPAEYAEAKKRKAAANAAIGGGRWREKRARAVRGTLICGR